MKNGKICPSCTLYKDYELYPKSKHENDGYLVYCKECANAKNRDYYRRNKDKVSKKVYEYKHTEKGKRVMNESAKKWKESNPKKYLSHLAVKQGLKYGFIEKKDCEVCGDPEVHAHHDDYDKPWDVVWLCPQHHKDHHAKLEANTPQEHNHAEDEIKDMFMGKPHTSDTSLDKVTRFEVIDEYGRSYSRWNTKIKLDYQDDGRTLKVFVEEQDNGKRD